MRPFLRLTVLAALAAASPAAAQLSNRSISVESGLSWPAGGAARVSLPVAIAATAWLDGPFEAVARLGFGSAPEPSGRGTVRRVEGTAGLRWSPGTDALRPLLQLELGWSHAGWDPAGASGLSAAAGAGLEWFAHRDLALGARAGLRRVPGEGWRPELALCASFYF
ncbi:hypothetical protein [Anaeromyxobacter sp. SG26]|uniref:hypothetical protein n=1 Tax=Anaeromyxobacter sp. SG26 TaxID=2925407 RepID=UPI001F5A192D|nr:hypothetical protein [Anaeromyxobacter sp. SG26]